MGSRPRCYLFSALSVLCRGVVLRTKDTRDSVLDAWTMCWQRRVMAVRGNWEEWVGMNFEIRKGVCVCVWARTRRKREEPGIVISIRMDEYRGGLCGCVMRMRSLEYDTSLTLVYILRIREGNLIGCCCVCVCYWSDCCQTIVRSTPYSVVDQMTDEECKESCESNRRATTTPLRRELVQMVLLERGFLSWS